MIDSYPWPSSITANIPHQPSIHLWQLYVYFREDNYSVYNVTFEQTHYMYTFAFV